MSASAWIATVHPSNHGGPIVDYEVPDDPENPAVVIRDDGTLNITMTDGAIAVWAPGAWARVEVKP